MVVRLFALCTYMGRSSSKITAFGIQEGIPETDITLAIVRVDAAESCQCFLVEPHPTGKERLRSLQIREAHETVCKSSHLVGRLKRASIIRSAEFCCLSSNCTQGCPSMRSHPDNQATINILPSSHRP
jgi:hypothetical protein